MDGSVLFCVSYAASPVFLLAIIWLSNSSCPALDVLSWLSCSGCPFFPVLFLLSYFGCPGMTVMLWRSSSVYFVSAVLGAVFWLSRAACPVLAILICCSVPGMLYTSTAPLPVSYTTLWDILL
jgi:hypothetical protein